MPSNLTGWVVAGAGLVTGAFLANLVLRMFGQAIPTMGS